MLIEQFSRELVDGIRGVLGQQVTSIILYGSVARGIETEDSDIDIALIVNKELDHITEELLSEFVVDMNLKHDRVFSVIDIENDVIRELEDIVPFYRNIMREGIVLWDVVSS